MTISQQATQVCTIVAAGTIIAKRAIAWTGAQAGAGAAIAGIADHSGVAGDAIRVVQGATAVAEAGAAIDGSVANLVCDAQGRLIPAGSGTVVAKLVPGEVATAAGQYVEVFPLIVS